MKLHPSCSNPGRLLLASLPLLVAFSGCTMVGPPPSARPAPTLERPAPQDAPSPATVADPPPQGRPATAAVLPPRTTGDAGRIAPLTFSEVRALWVVRTALSHPDSARAMVRRADEAGFNTLIVQVRGRGDAYYGSRWEPRSHTLANRPRDFDPLDVVLREAHVRGIHVHAWVNTHLIASANVLPDDPDHLLHRRPDLLAVPRELARELYTLDPRDPRYVDALVRWTRQNADRVEGLYTNPAHPEVREHMYSLWMDLLERYPLDGIHFDYIRYATPDFDYSRESLLRFREWMIPRLAADRIRELDRSMGADPLTYPLAYPAEWGDFRREQNTRLVERIYFGVKKRRPAALVSAAVFANAADAYGARYQEWERWLRSGIVDVVAPMAYTTEDGVFAEQIRTAVAAAGDGGRVWAGIGVYRNSFGGTMSKIGIARGEGAGGIVLFSYDWTVQREGISAAGGPYLPRIRDEAFHAPVSAGVPVPAPVRR
ncbi:MAG: family 10 glycosylhydrolase [Gemmatimonadota bacterium]